MASLFIKDSETAALAERVARRLGTTKTEAVRRGLTKIEADIGEASKAMSTVEWLQAYRRENPLPRPSGLKADKAFFDWLSSEEDVEEPNSR